MTLGNRRNLSGSGTRGAKQAGHPRRRLLAAIESLESRTLLTIAAPVAYDAGSSPNGYIPNAAPASEVTGDFTGDGKLDLVVANVADDAVYFLKGNGNGTFQGAVKIPLGVPIDGDIFTGNFNGDGKLDLFLPSAVFSSGGSALDSQAIVLLGNGNGTFGAPIVSSSFNDPGYYARGWTVGDFTNNGKDDIAFTLPTNSTPLSRYGIVLGNGNGTFGSPIIGPAVLGYSRWITSGDFNHDGKLDLAVADGQGTSTVAGAQVQVLLGDGKGNFTLAGSYASPQFPNGIGWQDANATSNPEDVTAADLTGNGILDLIVSDYSSTVNVFMGNGNGTFQPAVSYDPGNYPRTVQVADLTNNGKMDLIVTSVGIDTGGAIFGTVGAFAGSVSIMMGNGDGTFQQPIAYTPSAFPGYTVVGDFNGDGYPDLATEQVSDGVAINVMLNEPGSSNLPPTFENPASATPQSVKTGTATALSVLGADDFGESKLTYTWSSEGAVPAPVKFGANGTNAAQNSTATFSTPGTYILACRETDPAGFYSIELVTVTVTPGSSSKPVITTNPVSQSVGYEAAVTFTAAASGTPAPSVQWQISTNRGASWTNISGATSATFTFHAGLSENGDWYRAVFTNSAGSATTAAATLTVTAAKPAITTNPVSQTAAQGASVHFTAAASGNPAPTVQWQVSNNGGASYTNISGATSAAYTLTAGLSENGDLYRAVFSSFVGSATTAAAKLTVSSSASGGTLTVYSLAGDGRVRDFGDPGIGLSQWNTVHNAASGNEADYTSADRANLVGTGALFGPAAGQDGVDIMRGYLAFDTASIPANAVITSATVGLYVTGKDDSISDGNDFIAIVQGFQASGNSLVVGDYSKAGNAIDNPTEGSNRLSIPSLAVNGYDDWTLNSAGLAWITRGGITKLALREGHDLLNAWPNYAAGQGDVISADMSETPGTAFDPYLQVTYTIPKTIQPAIELNPVSQAPAAGQDASAAGGLSTPSARLEASAAGGKAYAAPGAMPKSYRLTSGGGLSDHQYRVVPMG